VEVEVEVEVGSELESKTREHYLARWADYTEMDMRAAKDGLSATGMMYR